MTTVMCSVCATPAEPLAWRCAACGGALTFGDWPRFHADRIIADDFSLWRYQAMLPVQRRVTLGEGLTPLTRVSVEGDSFWAKLEYLNPTGSYKDRGTTTLINHMAAYGVRAVVEDSSGNAGASVAAFAVKAGMHPRIFVPSTGDPAKKGLIRSLGGELVEVPGPQYAKTQACQQAAESTPYASHAWSPYFLLGQMTVAWEVWEQLGRRAPDAVATPIGHGGLFLGFAYGFRALLQAGLIARMPTLFGVQSEGCAPIALAWEAGADHPAEVTPTPTIADGIIVDHPVRGVEVLRAIRESGGAALRVGNDAIAQARDQLYRAGLTVEPTSAVTVAALPRIRERIGPSAELVIAFTGNGLKFLGR